VHGRGGGSLCREWMLDKEEGRVDDYKRGVDSHGGA